MNNIFNFNDFTCSSMLPRISIRTAETFSFLFRGENYRKLKAEQLNLNHIVKVCDNRLCNIHTKYF